MEIILSQFDIIEVQNDIYTVNRHQACEGDFLALKHGEAICSSKVLLELSSSCSQIRKKKLS